MSSRTHYFQTQHRSPSQAQSQSQPQSHQHLRPLRQSHTIDFASNSNISPSLLNRFPSTTSSSASSGYSHASDHSLNSQYTSASSSAGYGATVHGHKRAQSDVRARAKTFEAGENMTSKKAPENMYSSARHSLRPLPQAPASTPPSTPPHAIPRHGRGQSVDIGKLSMAHIDGHSSPTKTSTSPIKTSPVKTSSPSRPLPMRPNSMLLTRSDSFLPPEATQAPSSPHHVHSTHIARDELEGLGKSSTSQLRTLSRLVSSDSPEDFTITSPAQEVVGLRGRRRLQRADRSNGGQSQKSTGYSWEGRNWMDKQRQFLQAYEYLCHIGEAKEWIEDVIHKSIPPIVELEEALRDGVTLAEVVEALNPDRRYRIFQHPRLQYRHSDNIAIFFRYLDEVELPDLFRFELIDLYEKKNIPKVIYCIHALSWLLFRKGIVDFRIGNLVGQLEFEHHELEAMQKGLDKLGVTMPSFGNMSADFGVPEPEPEPEETEEERIERELRENEESIVDMQAQIRGALLRVKLGETMQTLWDEEEWLIDLQSRIRGDFTRQIMDYRLQMKRFAIQLQSSARGFLARRRLDRRDQILEALEPDILELQTMIRANKARNQVRNVTAQLAKCRGPIREIQAISRGFLARKSHVAQYQETKESSGIVEKLQAAARGALLRGKVDQDLEELEAESPAIVDLQAAARALLTRTQVNREQQHLRSFGPQWKKLQAFARGFRARQDDMALKSELNKHSPAIEQLQALARGLCVRQNDQALRTELSQHAPAVERLQAFARGFRARQDDMALKSELNKHSPAIEQLQALARGLCVRQNDQALRTELSQHAPA
ncbi:iqgap-related protein, partial [Fusarium odoratissimum]